jgi:hypothetical protein
MDAQLRLIPRPAALRDGEAGHAGEAAEAPSQWRIDDGARERGRAGITRAREALRNARRPLPGERHTTAA